jgi:hypothetical protein
MDIKVVEDKLFAAVNTFATRNNEPMLSWEQFQQTFTDSMEAENKKHLMEIMGIMLEHAGVVE